MNTTTFTAPDIVCGGCANAIKRALGTLPSVSDVSVDVGTKLVTVAHEKEQVGRQDIVAALDRAGFPVSDMSAAQQSK